jgi:hypothetical protein
MEHLKRHAWLPLVLTLVLLAACGGSPVPTATADSGPVFTQIAMTALAYQTQTALAAPTETQTPQASPTLEATNTPLMTETPQGGAPTNTPLVLATATTGSLQNASSCDNSAYVADVNFPDGSEVVAGTPFTKTWRIKNTGPCAWTKDYRLAFGWGGTGTNWSTTVPVNLTGEVASGDSVEISVVLKAPTTPGDYAAAFRMQNDKGFYFGASVTVVVTVK